MSAASVCRAGLAVSLSAFAVLALLTLAMQHGQTASFDRAVLDHFAAARGPALDGFFLAVTWLGASHALVPATVLILALLAARRQWASVWSMGTIYFGAALTTWMLKQAAGRERPQLHAALAEVARSDWSFPSGHATHAAAFALGLWLLLARLRPAWRVPAGLVLGAVVLLVAASRLHLQVHWPSDVLAGILVALFWAGLASTFGRRERAS